jgi:plasmid maintenance system antidote protein VapI
MISKVYFDPDWVISPGETLQEWLDEHKPLSVRSLATICGRMNSHRLQRIIDGKQKITRLDAERLEHGTGIPASLWLNLERAFRQGLAEGKTWWKPAPVSGKAEGGTER